MPAISSVLYVEHVSDMVFAVERLSSLVNAARTDLQAFKSREARHRKSTFRLQPPSISPNQRAHREPSTPFLPSLSPPCVSFLGGLVGGEMGIPGDLCTFVTTVAVKNRKRVTFWAVVECILIVVVAAAQIFRVEKFLESKRSI